MPTGLKRFQQTKNFHFITFSCYRRQPFLATEHAKDTLHPILEQVRRQQGLCIAAYVFMPEHIHLLTDEPSTGTLATFLQIFKQLTSRELKSSDQKQFWQRRYYDFNVHSPEKRIEKIRYIPPRHISILAGADRSCRSWPRTKRPYIDHKGTTDSLNRGVSLCGY